MGDFVVMLGKFIVVMGERIYIEMQSAKNSSLILLYMLIIIPLLFRFPLMLAKLDQEARRTVQTPKTWCSHKGCDPRAENET
jgi:hypothetical protein